MTTRKTTKCSTCQGYGFWGIGLPAPMGSMDAREGTPTIPCPKCGANPNPLDTYEIKKRAKTLDREIFDEMCLGLSYQYDNELTLAIDDLWDWISKYVKEAVKSKAPTEQGEKVKEMELPQLPKEFTGVSMGDGITLFNSEQSSINQLIVWATAVTSLLKIK